MNRENTCCFSGHRPSRLPWGDNEQDARCIETIKKLNDILEDTYRLGYRHFLCGMALGADLYFAEAVLLLKKQYNSVTLEAAIPFEGQSAYWSDRDRARWAELLRRCDYETVVQHQYSKGCMQRRNRYMVDRSSLLISLYDGQPYGGTATTLRYALKQGLDVRVLNVQKKHSDHEE